MMSFVFAGPPLSDDSTEAKRRFEPVKEPNGGFIFLLSPSEVKGSRCFSTERLGSIRFPLALIRNDAHVIW